MKNLRRGVFRAPYLVNGLPVLVAIDRHGNARKHLKVPPGADLDRCFAWMEAKLDVIDPGPQLRLVKTTPSSMPREIDPRLYEDPRSPLHKRRYMNNLVRAAAAKIPTAFNPES